MSIVIDPPLTLPLAISWPLLPADYPLPDDPVDNITQPLLAQGLNEALATANRLPAAGFVSTNYGLCARINQQFVVKAPDWCYVPRITVPKHAIERSYTPYTQGDTPLIVMEFLSETEGGEYSSQLQPFGKWRFYEQVLQVSWYVIFEPIHGHLDVYHRDPVSGCYQRQSADRYGRYWLTELALFLGVWHGEAWQRSGYWLRWWDAQGQLLLWGFESREIERQRADMERQRADTADQQAEAERQRADTADQRAKAERQRADLEAAKAATLAAKLRSMGFDIEDS